MVSTLQLSVMIGKLTAVRESVPSVAHLGDGLSWTAFQFKPPKFLQSSTEQQKNTDIRRLDTADDSSDGDNTLEQHVDPATHLVLSAVGSDVVDTFNGSAVWLWIALGLFVVFIHVPFHFLSSRYLSTKKSDDKKKKKKTTQKKRQKKGIKLVKRLLPRAELSIVILAFQASQDSTEHFFRSNALHCIATVRILIVA